MGRDAAAAVETTPPDRQPIPRRHELKRKFVAAALAAPSLATPAIAQQERPASVAPPAMQRWAPDLAKDTDNILFGDVWRRTELSPRDRSLVTVSVLIATGKSAQLEGHLGRALDNGLRPAEIGGLVTHLAYYSGWPNAVSALTVIDAVMRKRGIDPATARTTGTPSPAAPSEPQRAARVEQQVAPTAPKLAELTNAVLFADLWRRPDLTPRDRSLVTIAALAAAGDADQLGFHLQRGIENGLSHAQIAEALTHLAFYAGWPKAMGGITALSKAASANESAEAKAPPLTVSPAGSAPRRGPAANFTGRVTVDTAFAGTGGSRLSGARVTFDASARSNWHRHLMGQLLIVTEGTGYVQEEGSAARTVNVGDVVWTAPGIKHWHGATPSGAFTHFAVAESVDGAVVEWLEPVTDAVYPAPTAD